MKDKEKNEIIDQLNNGTLDNNKKDNLYKKSILYFLITAVIIGCLFILSLCFNSRINRFSILFGDFVFGNKNFGIVIYYLLIVIGLLYYSALTITLFVMKKHNTNKIIIPYKIDRYADLPIFIVKAFLIVSFIAIFIFTPCNVSGGSMDETLKDSDKLILWNLGYEPANNDIIVFDAEKIDHENVSFIKRVIAVEDDQISYIPENAFMGKLYVNDELVEEELFATEWLRIINYENNELVNSNLGDTFIIPDNKTLVLGDNRSVSKDSRSFGLIDNSQIIGKAIFRIFPFNKMGGLE